jgi:hypothetical protein
MSAKDDETLALLRRIDRVLAAWSDRSSGRETDPVLVRARKRVEACGVGAIDRDELTRLVFLEQTLRRRVR